VLSLEDFLKNLKKEFSKGVAAVSAKSKELIETAKIKGQIEDLKESKRRLFQEIGEIIYQMSLDPNCGGEEVIKEKCRAVTELEQEIQTKEGELKKIYQEAQKAAGKSVCESCGAVMDEDAKFCSNCGARIVIVEKGDN